MSKDLEEEGLVVSKQSEIDKRCRLMFLTEKGKNVLKSFLAKLDQFLGDASPEIEQSLIVLSSFLNKKN